MNATQLFFRLVQTVTTERAHSLVCIPDRTTAECELTALRQEYGERLIKAVIRKDRSRHASNRATYTLRYFTRDTEVVPLF